MTFKGQKYCFMHNMQLIKYDILKKYAKYAVTYIAILRIRRSLNTMKVFAIGSVFPQTRLRENNSNGDDLVALARIRWYTMQLTYYLLKGIVIVCHIKRSVYDSDMCRFIASDALLFPDVFNIVVA